MKTWKIYLSGEIHSDWRDEIKREIKSLDLPVHCTAPVTDHPASDNCGVDIFGPEKKDFWKDRKGAQLNAIRTRTHIEDADIVVVKFGEKYRQWNAAFDAGYAVALGKKLIIMHPPEHTHALKEVDAAALSVCETPAQIIDILTYVIKG
ncbi:MAG: YtoQ family protein [Balneolaceae bacterium]